MTDRFGNTYKIGLLGVKDPCLVVQRSWLNSWWYATVDVTIMANPSSRTDHHSAKSTDGLGGPLRIAQMSGMPLNRIVALVWFMALLSVNLGLINLFPVPMLDGGHLLFYVFEVIRGKPLSERAQEWGFRIGFGLIVSLMIFSTWNDIMLIFFK